MTANPIPSHPSPHQILNTLDSLELVGLPEGTTILLLHDGLRWTQRLSKTRTRYRSYLHALSQALATREDVLIVKLPRWGHISQLLRKGVLLTSAEFLLVVQHDLPFERTVDVRSILEFMQDEPGIRHVRFNLRTNLPQGQDAMTTLKAQKVTENRTDFFQQHESQSRYSVPLVRTLAWSDNNFLCPRWYLEKVILGPIGNLRMAPEWAMNGLNRPENHSILGTFIAGTIGDLPVISHTDGRNSSVGAEYQTLVERSYGTRRWVGKVKAPFFFARRALSLIVFRAKIALVARRAQRLWRRPLGPRILADN
ncbi:hypothetical protein N9H87_02000 [Pontimonas sp.]|nr:hypothetical protein [Pontimonas sp.]